MTEAELETIVEAPAPTGQGSALRATALLGGSSFVSILVGLVAAKAWALLVGPRGVGQLALLQSLSGLLALGVGLGVGTGIVRLGAATLAQGDVAHMQALRSAAWRLVWGFWIIAAALLAVFARPVSRLMLGTPDDAPKALLMGVAALATISSGLFIGILNAHHRVGTIAKVSVLTSVLGAAAAITVLAIGRERAVPIAVIANAVAGCLVAWYFTPRAPSRTAVSREARATALRELLRFGGPYTLSVLLGAGVQFIMPTLVLHRLGGEQVGYYRAAISISSSYLALLVTAFAKDYYPRVSAVSGDAGRLAVLLDEQHRLVMYLAAPMCLAFQAGAVWLIPLVYSHAFAPTVRILEWQLVGELFRFSSYTLAHIILARSRSSRYLLTETISGVCLVVFSVLGMRLWGTTGLGVAYAAMYAVYFVVVSIVTYQEIGATLNRANFQLLGWSVGAALVIAALGATTPRTVQLPIAALIALAAGLATLRALRGELAGFRRQLAARLGRSRSSAEAA